MHLVLTSSPGENVGPEEADSTFSQIAAAATPKHTDLAL